MSKNYTFFSVRNTWKLISELHSYERAFNELAKHFNAEHELRILAENAGRICSYIADDLVNYLCYEENGKFGLEQKYARHLMKVCREMQKLSQLPRREWRVRGFAWIWRISLRVYANGLWWPTSGEELLCWD